MPSLNGKMRDNNDKPVESIEDCESKGRIKLFLTTSKG